MFVRAARARPLLFGGRTRTHALFRICMWQFHSRVSGVLYLTSREQARLFVLPVRAPSSLVGGRARTRFSGPACGSLTHELAACSTLPLENRHVYSCCPCAPPLIWWEGAHARAPPDLHVAVSRVSSVLYLTSREQACLFLLPVRAPSYMVGGRARTRSSGPACGSLTHELAACSTLLLENRHVYSCCPCAPPLVCWEGAHARAPPDLHVQSQELAACSTLPLENNHVCSCCPCVPPLFDGRARMYEFL